MTTKAGELDRRIDILNKTEEQDEWGEITEVWVIWKTCWANVRSISATERFRAQAVHAVLTNSFTVRFMDGVDPTMRVNYAGREWKITGIAEIGRREALQITAEAYS